MSNSTVIFICVCCFGISLCLAYIVYTLVKFKKYCMQYNNKLSRSNKCKADEYTYYETDDSLTVELD